MPKRILSILMVALLTVLLVPSLAFAADVSLDLSNTTVKPGDSVIASGSADANTWVSIKILDSAQSIVFFDAVKSGEDGSYSITFKVPDVKEGTLTVVAGYGSNVATESLIVVEERPSSGGGGGGGGGSSASKPVTSTTGAAIVKPNAGGKISLGSDVSINIPAGALKGTDGVEVKIQKVSTPPVVPTGFKLLGSVFEFTVDGKTDYSFAKPVTLTFTFDPALLTAEETPAVYYYDESSSKWVELAGSVSDNTITVTVDHFTRFAVLAKSKEVVPAPEVPEVQPFSDVPAIYWASDAISKLKALGCISGYPDGTFKPDNNITRSEFATILVNAYKLPAASDKVFNDTADHWARESIAAAYAAGIVTGYSESTFGPDDLITREQMAVMIVKAAKIEAATAELPFTDSDKISLWARDALAAAVQNGIMKGYPDGSFNPQRKATRAEAAAVIANALK